ncbi:MAG: DNA-binding protein [Methanospirillaceae archaeon]|nr:DNA-binding protein [Methanospirillaceae archaeon]
MGNDELAEIRRKRMTELQEQASMQAEEAARQKQQDAQVQMALMQILEPEARERLNAIKLTRPEFVSSVEQQLISLAQSGRIPKKITDEQLKAMLQQAMPQKREFNIRRKG